jgi:uncharacterized protein with von Willebrand factor type A (vWA) domain
VLSSQPGTTGGFLDSVIGFAEALRRAGVPVSMGECVDAAGALNHVDLIDRQAVRNALCATLVKREEHLPVFSALFATWFRAAQHQVEGLFPDGETQEPDPGRRDPYAGLPDALRRADLAALRSAAAAAVAQFGGLDTDRALSSRHHVFRVLRGLDLTRLMQRAMASGDSPTLDRDQLARVREHMAEFRRMVIDEVRALLAERTGQDTPLRWDEDINDADFLGASPTQLKAMRDAVRPLARRLATRLARRRQLRSQGRIDMRRTARRSLSSGGVPIDPAFRRRPSHRPDLFVLCDLSGSVAEFARFTITLLHALYQELPKTRLFVFVDNIDEVTALVERLRSTLDVGHLLAATEAVGADGHSDYGAVFERFWSRFGPDVSSTSTLIIAGDGRTNYRDAGTATLGLLHRKARRLYWLNPEPRQEWGTSDSSIDAYRRYCDQLVEVRNLHQLSDFISRLV